jgi:hypothetical protein
MEKIEELIDNALKPNPEWDSNNRRSPNIIISKLLEFASRKNPSLRFTQLFGLFEIDIQNLNFNTESKDILDIIQNSSYYKEISDEFIDSLEK